MRPPTNSKIFLTAKAAKNAKFKIEIWVFLAMKMTDPFGNGVRMGIPG